MGSDCRALFRRIREHELALLQDRVVERCLQMRPNDGLALGLVHLVERPRDDGGDEARASFDAHPFHPVGEVAGG